MIFFFFFFFFQAEDGIRDADVTGVQTCALPILLGRPGVAAEYAAVDEGWVYSTPPSYSDREAAAVALTGITAHLGLFRSGHLKAGETVYVPGGTGGVGSMGVQMAKAAGARVATS